MLCFGWWSSPYIYHSLSLTVARYLRSKGIPVLAWIDDFYITNFSSTQHLAPEQQFEAAQAAAYLALAVFYRAGYFMSIPECVIVPTTRIVFLGVVCDSELRRFEVPDAISSQMISFAMSEKLAGKCTSMSVVVPAAGLYTHHMYKFPTYGRQATQHQHCVTPKKWYQIRNG